VNLLIGSLGIGLGFAYIALGVLAVYELLLERRSLGVSRFGLGFALMASSCGPHHVLHGHHVQMGLDTSPVLAIATLIGLPAGLTFVVLRVEALLGGRGDRFIVGTPTWLIAAPIVFFIAAGALANAAIRSGGAFEWRVTTAPNLFVTVTYSLVGWPLLRTQIRRRPEAGGWSLSGLALAAIFPTCALMHLTYALGAAGDSHTTIVDLWGVPASMYFLWVVQALYHDAIADWNRRPIVGMSRRTRRPSPWHHGHAGRDVDV
jgi:hypothetical protein